MSPSCDPIAFDNRNVREGEWMQRLAPAKINLFLHVLGRDDRGYHLLESLFVFADIGDVVRVRHAQTNSFKCSGEFSKNLPTDNSNLVIRAANALRERANNANLAAEIHLEKNLPIASGIGGGSSDAAAALLLLNELWELRLSHCDLFDIALALGADVPACLDTRPKFVQGIGEKTSYPKTSDGLYLVLVNNGMEVATPDVFKMYSEAKSAFSKPLLNNKEITLKQVVSHRNDLELVAAQIEPNIAKLVNRLAQQEGCAFARMSGSGGTCFGVFTSQNRANLAAEKVRSSDPQLWVKPCSIFNA